MCRGSKGSTIPYPGDDEPAAGKGAAGAAYPSHTTCARALATPFGARPVRSGGIARVTETTRFAEIASARFLLG